MHLGLAAPQIKLSAMRRMLLILLPALLCAGARAASPVVTTVVVAKDGSGDFTTIQAAVNSLRSFKPEGRSCVYVKKGVYEEKVLIHSHKAEITLLGEDRDSTVIRWHDHGNLPDGMGGTIGTFLSYTLRVDAPDFVCENLTVENDAMTHYNPRWFEDGRNDAGVAQAVALHVEGDRAEFRHCRFLGFQDTVYTGNPDGREYYEDCYIEGTVDFVFGPATCWFERCHIHALRKGYLTAASTPADHPIGYVFNRCRITAREGITGEWLGRPWRAWAYTLWKECELDLDLDPAGWHNWGNPENEKTARYLEYRCTGRGADRSQRAPWSRELSPREARKVTPQAAFRRLQADWLP